MLERLLNVWRRRYWRPAHEPDPEDAATPFVLITGGSAGIGQALAERFARSGAALLLVARNRSRLEAVRAELIARHKVPVVVAAVDLTQSNAIAEIAQALADARGYVDILVNNAGIGLSGSFVMQPTSDLSHLCDLNMRAPTELTRAFLPGMLRRGRGGVLMVGSLGGLVPGPNQAAYYASKAYLQSLTEALAEETKGQGVRISIVVPGPVATDFHKRMGAQDALYLRLVPVMSAAQVARSAHFWFRFGRTTIVPGALHHVSVVALRIMPHSVILPLIGWILRRRTPIDHV